jgi:hypothetical protein
VSRIVLSVVCLIYCSLSYLFIDYSKISDLMTSWQQQRVVTPSDITGRETRSGGMANRYSDGSYLKQNTT